MLDILYALLAIIILDLILSGDNAVVIALASRKLPEAEKKKAIIYGTIGAVVFRVIFTLLAVWLMAIPYLQTIGAALLLYIAVKLLLDNQESEGSHVEQKTTFWGAVGTILVADITLSLDNVFAVAGAANSAGEHSFALVIFGLILSVPIMVWGSSMIQKAISKFPIIIYIGSALLGWAAGKMILAEDYMSQVITDYGFVKWIIPLAFAAVVVLIGKVKSRKKDDCCDIQIKEVK